MPSDLIWGGGDFIHCVHSVQTQVRFGNVFRHVSKVDCFIDALKRD